MSDPGWRISVAIAAVLVAATLTAMVLKHSVARGAPHQAIDNLALRIRSWWVMAALLGAAFWAGTGATCLLFAGVALMALREYIVTDANRNLRTWAGGVAICIVCIAFVPALLWLDIPAFTGRNVYLLVFLILVAQSCDVLQYIWGKLLGRRLIAPSISPGKTVEGFVGGVASATLLGASVWWLTPFTPLQAAGVALLITLLGFGGGLLLSAQKRARGIKDWGDLIQGHGGVLDRLDSLWLPAPVYFTLLKLGFGAS